MRNVGRTDRIIRVAVGLVWLAAVGPWGGAWAYVGLLPLATGLVGYCPLYQLLRINTFQRSVPR
jgi:hypothetical protein